MVGRVMDIPPEKTFPKNRRNFCFELMLSFALKTRNFSFFSGTIYQDYYAAYRKIVKYAFKNCIYLLYSRRM